MGNNNKLALNEFGMPVYVSDLIARGYKYGEETLQHGYISRKQKAKDSPVAEKSILFPYTVTGYIL